MTKVVNLLCMGVLGASMTACNSATSPVEPTPAGGLAGGLTAGASTVNARPGFAEAAKPGPKTIAGIVVDDDGEFDVLQAAVIRAGLVDTLNGRGQFTVFARPTGVRDYARRGERG